MMQLSPRNTTLSLPYRIVCILLITFSVVSVIINDLYVPETCENIAEPGDHLLVEYELKYVNGTVATSLSAPHQLFHIQLSNDDVPLMKGLKGVCKNGTRQFLWEKGSNVDYSPIFQLGSPYSSSEETLSLLIKVVHLTSQQDFQIFDALKTGNLSLALDMIEGRKGINAVDQWGFTPLMLAVSKPRDMLTVISFLMNTRRPMVDVNLAKASGFTALNYAVEHATVDIVVALLRRGSDPNVVSIAVGSKGNTPLHYACFLEKYKHAEALLEYGANPYATNEHGENPFQMIPKDAVRSTKLTFQRIFQETEKKLASQIGGGSSTRSQGSREL